jgi:hypothetical protein
MASTSSTCVTEDLADRTSRLWICYKTRKITSKNVYCHVHKGCIWIISN